MDAQPEWNRANRRDPKKGVPDAYGKDDYQEHSRPVETGQTVTQRIDFFISLPVLSIEFL